MKHFYLLIFVFFSVHLAQAQYLEEFSTANKGVLFGPCGATGTTCASFDFSGENYWSIGGNLSGIDSEGLKTVAGSLQFADVDELSCFISPPIDISGVAASSISVEVTFSGGWGTDYGNVSYFVDALPEVIIPHVTGCGGTATFGGGCAFADGTYTASASGIIGDEITVMVCLDANASAEIADVNFVRVPEAGGVVPVSWNKFNATLKENGNLLEWTTETEINNDMFQVERSVGKANNFEVIATIDGARNSTEEKKYSYLDLDVEDGAVYFYRIKQIDLDGRSSFSRMLSLQRPVMESITVGPNPFTSEIHVNFTESNTSNQRTITIYNGLGAMVKELTVNGSEIIIDTDEFLPGIYYLSSGNTYKKIIKAN